MGRFLNMLRVAIASTIILVPLAVVVPAFAADNNIFDPACQGANVSGSTLCKDKNKAVNSNPLYGPNGIISKVLDVIAFIVGVAAVFALVVGGINYMLASGDPGKVNSAKSTIVFAVIGIVVAVAAQGIVKFVLNKL